MTQQERTILDADDEAETLAHEQRLTEERQTVKRITMYAWIGVAIFGVVTLLRAVH